MLSVTRFFICLSVALSGANAITFLLDSTQYPDIADHHCVSAFCAGLGFTTRNYGFHRSTSNNYMAERRKAVGCGTSTTCGSGKSCSNIPYENTFDGGLGCYSDAWALSGRTMAYLYKVATKRCVPSNQIQAHAQSLQKFYDQNNIQNFQLYSVDVATVSETGYADPRSTYCNKFIQAALSGQDFGSICSAAYNDGLLFQKITSPSQFNRGSCPTRDKYNWKRDDEPVRRHHRRQFGWLSGLFGSLPAPVKSTTTPALNSATSATATSSDNTTISFSLLENGMKTLNLFGPHDVGQTVWGHDSFAQLFNTPGRLSKIQKNGNSAGIIQAGISTVASVLNSIFGLLP